MKLPKIVSVCSAFALLPIVAPVSAAEQYSFSFTSAEVYPGGDWCRWVTTADFNGDGYLDIATANEGAHTQLNNSMSVFLNNKDGTLALRTDYVSGGDTAVNGWDGPIWIGSADFNKDGFIDIVTANMYEGSISVFSNKGDGTFDAQQVYQIELNGLIGGSVADANSDGWMDILVPHYHSGNVHVLLNDSTGHFLTDKIFSNGAGSNGSSVGDLNGDGVADAVIVRSANDVATYFNDGTGTFGQAERFSNGSYSAAIGDTTGDGKADIVSLNGSTSVQILSNDGTGHFQESAVYTLAVAGNSVEIHDINNDGYNDVVVGSVPGSNGTPQILINDGSGILSTSVILSTNSPSYYTTAADISNDGLIDIISPNSDTNTVSVFRQFINIGTQAADQMTVLTNGTGLGLGGSDQIVGSSGSETLIGGDGADTLTGDPVVVAASQPFTGSTSFAVAISPDDKLTGGKGNDTLNGGEGIDTATYSGNRAEYAINYNSSIGVFTVADTNTGRDDIDSVSNVEYLQFADVTVDTSTLIINKIQGTELADILNGTSGDDEVYGLGGNDTLMGNAGNDLLDGGTGADNMTGGDGNDTYFIDNTSDVITESVSGGNDTVKTSLSSYTLPANVENLIYIGSGNFAGTGNALGNSITGGPGSDTLNGTVGADTLAGGSGNDNYTFDNSGDSATEGVNGGTDKITSSVSATLGPNIENLTLTGTSGLSGTGNDLDNSLIGNSGSNTLIGGTGNDTLNGGSGADGMYGNAGDDSYVFDNASDIAYEDANSGTDKISSSVTTTISANIENLTLTGSSSINGIGNALNNQVIGNPGANVLSGWDGSDTLNGGAGNDTFYGNTSSIVGTDVDTVSFEGATTAIRFNLGLTTSQTTGGAGSDRIPNGSIENLIGGSAGDTLTGTTGANRIEGAAGNDSISGLAGTDVLVGNAGLDTIDCGSETSNSPDTVVYLSAGDSPVGTTRDQILNFKSGDLINLSAIDPNTALAGDQAFLFKSTTPTAYSVWYLVSGTDIIVKGDINGDTTADFEILIKGTTSIIASAFNL